jgi:hypothetical protein
LVGLESGHHAAEQIVEIGNLSRTRRHSASFPHPTAL